MEIVPFSSEAITADKYNNLWIIQLCFWSACCNAWNRYPRYCWERESAMDEGRLSILRPSSPDPWSFLHLEEVSGVCHSCPGQSHNWVPVPILWSCLHLVINWHPSAFFPWLGSYEFIYLVLVTQHAGSCFPEQGINPCPLRWTHGVLTAGDHQRSQAAKFSAITSSSALRMSSDLPNGQKSYCLALGIGVGSPGLNESNTQLFLALGMIVIA